MEIQEFNGYSLMDLLCSYETEAHLLRYIASELQREPYKQEVTFANLTQMSYADAFEVFKVVLEEIDPKQKNEIETEDEDLKIKRLVELFSVLKYKPNNGQIASQYLNTMFQRRNVNFLWELLGWAIPRMHDLKKRAYLSKFLTKINIPSEFLMDPEIAEVYEAYENKIEDFKYIHRKCEGFKTTEGVAYFKQELLGVDRDINNASRKLELLKARIPDNERNNSSNLKDAHELSGEKTRNKELKKQYEEDKKYLEDLEIKCYYRERTWQELVRYNSLRYGETLIQHLENNYRQFKYMVEVKIPCEIHEAQRSLTIMRIVEAAPPLSEDEIDDLRQKVLEAKGSIVDMEETRKNKGEILMLSKLREDAKLVAMRKSLWKENISKMIQDCKQLRQKVEEKRIEKSEKSAQKAADKALYHKVSGIVGKYKKMKVEMNNLQTEVGVLSTTKLLLEGELDDSEAQLRHLTEGEVSQRTVVPSSGSETQRSTKTYDENTLRYLSQQSTLANELREKVAQKGFANRQLMERVEELRQKACILELQYNKYRSVFENEIIANEKPIRDTTEFIEQLKEQIERDELQYSEYVALIPKLKCLFTRASEEPNDSNETEVDSTGMAQLKKGVYSFKSKLLAHIVEQERVEREMNEELTDIDKYQDVYYQQLEMWSDLHRILKEKRRLREMEDNINLQM